MFRLKVAVATRSCTALAVGRWPPSRQRVSVVKLVAMLGNTTQRAPRGSTRAGPITSGAPAHHRRRATYWSSHPAAVCSGPLTILIFALRVLVVLLSQTRCLRLQGGHLSLPMFTNEGSYQRGSARVSRAIAQSHLAQTLVWQFSLVPLDNCKRFAARLGAKHVESILQSTRRSSWCRTGRATLSPGAKILLNDALALC